MPDNKTVYSHYADEYEALIAREDYQGNILRTLEEIVPDLRTRFVLDLGAGTGRLARLLAPHVTRVRAFDESAGMLRVCRPRRFRLERQLSRGLGRGEWARKTVRLDRGDEARFNGDQPHRPV
jgi:SAM-dependent methyltransferase